MAKSLRSKTIQAILWTAISQFGTQFLTIVITVALMRLIDPEEFGLITMIVIFTGFSNILMNVGFGHALIQKKEITEAEKSSVFWVNIFIGSLLTIAIALSAPLIAAFYGEPRLINLARAISCIYLITSFGLVQRTLFARQLNFKILSIIELFVVSVAGFVAFVLAKCGFDVWALVAQQLLVALFTVIPLWCYSSWKPKLIFDIDAIKGLTGFSLGFLGTKSLNYWITNLDSLLVGYAFGANSLGIFNRAFRLSRMPVRSFAMTLGRVFFPALSAIQQNLNKIREIFVRLNLTVGFLILPLMLLLFVVADELVHTFLHEKWLPLIPIVKVFSFVRIFSTFIVINDSVFFALGKSTLLFRISLACQLFVVTCILVGLQYGLIGVAYGILVGNALFASVVLVSACHLVRQPFVSFLNKMKPLGFLNIVLLIVLLIAKSLLLDFTTDFTRLLILVGLATFTYLALSHIFRLQPLVELRNLW